MTASDRDDAIANLPFIRPKRQQGADGFSNAAAKTSTRTKLKRRLKSDKPTQVGLAALCLAAGLIAFDLRASVIPNDMTGTEALTQPPALEAIPQTKQTATSSEQAAPGEMMSIAAVPVIDMPVVDIPVVDTPAKPAAPVMHEHTIGSGDTLSVALEKLGVPGDEAYDVISALSKHFNPRRLRVGQTLQAQFTPNAEGAPASLETLRLAIDRERTALIERTEAGDFKAEMKTLQLTAHPARAAGTIESSLYVAMDKADVPHGVIAELIRIFSFDVDFQREIRTGDKFDVLYEEKRAADGTMIRTGNIDYAALTVRGKTVGLYRYKDQNGFVGYYKADGKSSKKLLMRTPVDGARISSGFGKRRHPVLGYTKMHKGTDFAAPRGTPIMAAGDGIVEYAARYGSFGNYVRIRHNGTYKTAYAHMNGFARGIRKGKRVHQGQVIGYVGTTGRSTGPHLHYEVHKNGRQTNPLSLKLPTGKTLEGKDLAAFKSDRAKIDIVLAEIAPRNVTSVAEAQ